MQGDFETCHFRPMDWCPSRFQKNKLPRPQCPVVMLSTLNDRPLGHSITMHFSSLSRQKAPSMANPMHRSGYPYRYRYPGPDWGLKRSVGTHEPRIFKNFQVQVPSFHHLQSWESNKIWLVMFQSILKKVSIFWSTWSHRTVYTLKPPDRGSCVVATGSWRATEAEAWVAASMGWTTSKSGLRDGAMLSRFPSIFHHFTTFSHEFPSLSLIFPWVSHHLPRIFLWLPVTSHDFREIFPSSAHPPGQTASRTWDIISSWVKDVIFGTSQGADAWTGLSRGQLKVSHLKIRKSSSWAMLYHVISCFHALPRFE